MGLHVRCIALPLLDLIEFKPCIGEAEVVLDIGEIEDDLLFFAFEGTGDVLEASVEGLPVRKTIELVLLLARHQSFKMPLLATLHDGGWREAEVPAWLETYFARLLANVKAILIITQ